MYDELEALRERIHRLSNEELVRMLNSDYEQYREEALDYARAEAQRRGLKSEQVGFVASSQEDVDAAEAAAVETRYSAPESESESEQALEPEESRAHRVEFRVYRGVLASWDELFSEAAAFAAEVGPRRLINISHSEDANEGVVTVWYWA